MISFEWIVFQNAIWWFIVVFKFSKDTRVTLVSEAKYTYHFKCVPIYNHATKESNNYIYADRKISLKKKPHYTEHIIIIRILLLLSCEKRVPRTLSLSHHYNIIMDGSVSHRNRESFFYHRPLFFTKIVLKSVFVLRQFILIDNSYNLFIFFFNCSQLFYNHKSYYI